MSQSYITFKFTHSQTIGIATRYGTVGGQRDTGVIAEGCCGIQLDTIGAGQMVMMIVIMMWWEEYTKAIAAANAASGHWADAIAGILRGELGGERIHTCRQLERSACKTTASTGNYHKILFCTVYRLCVLYRIILPSVYTILVGIFQLCRIFVLLL